MIATKLWECTGTPKPTLHVATPDLHNEDLQTKRQVLSDVAWTFDVLGWFSPVTIKLEILLQSIWWLHLEWNQTLPEDLVHIWKSWRAQLPNLTSHPIPRAIIWLMQVQSTSELCMRTPLPPQHWSQPRPKWHHCLHSPYPSWNFVELSS